MRPTILAVLVSAAPAVGQEPLAVPAPPAGYPTDALLPAPDPTRWRTDVVVGLPVAVRVQRRVADSRTWVEAGVSTYGPLYGGFVGLRFDGRLHEGPRSIVHVRPGLDAYYSPYRDPGSWLFPEIRGAGVLALDFDLNWQYRWSDRFHSGLGLKLGLGAGYLGGSSAVIPVPVIGLTAGCQF